MSFEKNILIFLVLLLVGCADDKPVNLNELAKRGDRFFHVESGEHFTGVANLFDMDSGRLIERFSFENGVLHGKYERWYLNGTQMLEGEFQDGDRSSEWRRWNEDSSKRYEVNYKRGELNGDSYYYEKNNLSMKAELDSGSLHGVMINYFSNGNIESESEFVNGFVRKYTRYNESGFVSARLEFDKEGEVRGKQYLSIENDPSLNARKLGVGIKEINIITDGKFVIEYNASFSDGGNEGVISGGLDLDYLDETGKYRLWKGSTLFNSRGIYEARNHGQSLRNYLSLFNYVRILVGIDFMFKGE